MKGRGGGEGVVLGSACGVDIGSVVWPGHRVWPYTLTHKQRRPQREAGFEAPTGVKITPICVHTLR